MVAVVFFVICYPVAAAVAVYSAAILARNRCLHSAVQNVARCVTLKARTATAWRLTLSPPQRLCAWGQRGSGREVGVVRKQILVNRLDEKTSKDRYSY